MTVNLQVMSSILRALIMATFLKGIVVAAFVAGGGAVNEISVEEFDNSIDAQFSQIAADIEELKCSLSSRIIAIENDVASLKEHNETEIQQQQELQELCKQKSQGGTLCLSTMKCYSSVQLVKVQHDKALGQFCDRLQGGFLPVFKDNQEMQHTIDCLHLPHGEVFHVGHNPLSGTMSGLWGDGYGDYDTCDVMAVDFSGHLDLIIYSGQCGAFEKFFCEVPTTEFSIYYGR